MNICLGKLLKKCLNLYTTKEGEPLLAGFMFQLFCRILCSADSAPIITRVKEAMFYPAFVCLSVSNFTLKNCWFDLYKSFTRGVFWNQDLLLSLSLHSCAVSTKVMAVLPINKKLL